jgi:hypothetical protein
MNARTVLARLVAPIALALGIAAPAGAAETERLLDLAGELGASHVRGVREGHRHQGELHPLFLR